MKTTSDEEEDTELNVDIPDFEGSMDDGEDVVDFKKDEDGLTINHQDDTD